MHVCVCVKETSWGWNGRTDGQGRGTLFDSLPGADRAAPRVDDDGRPTPDVAPDVENRLLPAAAASEEAARTATTLHEPAKVRRDDFLRVIVMGFGPTTTTSSHTWQVMVVDRVVRVEKGRMDELNPAACAERFCCSCNAVRAEAEAQARDVTSDSVRVRTILRPRRAVVQRDEGAAVDRDVARLRLRLRRL